MWERLGMAAGGVLELAVDLVHLLDGKRVLVQVDQDIAFFSGSPSSSVASFSDLNDFVVLIFDDVVSSLHRAVAAASASIRSSLPSRPMPISVKTDTRRRLTGAEKGLEKGSPIETGGSLGPLILIIMNY